MGDMRCGCWCGYRAAWAAERVRNGPRMSSATIHQPSASRSITSLTGALGGATGPSDRIPALLGYGTSLKRQPPGREAVHPFLGPECSAGRALTEILPGKISVTEVLSVQPTSGCGYRSPLRRQDRMSGTERQNASPVR